METLKNVNEVVLFVILISIVPLFIFGFSYFLKQPVVRYPGHGWLDVKSYPIPDDIGYYIATDGDDVDHKYGITWGPHGQIYFSEYKKTYIKYWQPFPAPPEE